MPVRRLCVGDADEGAAWSASVAVFGRKAPFCASDVDEMDESSASLRINEIKNAAGDPTKRIGERIRLLITMDCSPGRGSGGAGHRW